jgi:hypothetical protein
MKIVLDFNRDWPPEGTHVIVLASDGTMEAATVCSAYQGGFIRGHVKPVAGVYYSEVLCDGSFDVRSWAVLEQELIKEMLY